MEKFDLENFPTSESAKRMLDSVTGGNGFYDESYVGKWLFQVMGKEWDSAREIFEDLPDQFFPETATWGLMFHELKWGLPIRENLPYEERRRLIYQKRDNRAPMTPYRMEIYLSDATGFDVHVTDVHDGGDYDYSPEHPNAFKVYFIGEGTLNTKVARQILDKIKQSHTVYQMNDWVHIVFDNTELEQFEAFKLKLNTAVNFWGLHMLNGDGYLDGSLILGGTGRYNLVPGIKYTEGDFEITETMDVSSANFKMDIPAEEQMLIKNAGTLVFQIENWKCLQLDGEVLLDGSKLLDVIRQDLNPTSNFIAAVKTKEEVGTVTLRTRRNLAYLDGTWKLNGSKLLNSINRKEEL